MSNPALRAASVGNLFREALRNLRQHPLRTALTALTSAVAIAVTVNVISLSRGLEADMRKDTARFGRRTVDVGRLPVLRAGLARKALGPKDAERIRTVLADLDPVIVPRRQVAGRAKGAATLDRVQIVGAPPTYRETLDVRLVAGRWPTPDEAATEALVCCLDAQAAVRLFPALDPAEVVGRMVEVTVGKEAHALEVVGVLSDPLTYRALFETFDVGRGSRTMTSSLLSFRNVYVLPALVPGNEFTGISIVLPDESAIPEAQRRLLAIWNQDASGKLGALLGGIGVFVRRDWMDLFGAKAGIGVLLGDLIWIVIVLVAAVMISTLSLITIRERYDELAIRRCEGARRRDIALQVSIEGVLTSLVGGLGGLPLGFIAADAMRRIVDFPFRFDLAYAGWAALIAAALGLLASVMPARRAASIQPARILTRRLT